MVRWPTIVSDHNPQLLNNQKPPFRRETSLFGIQDFSVYILAEILVEGSCGMIWKVIIKRVHASMPILVVCMQKIVVFLFVLTPKEAKSVPQVFLVVWCVPVKVWHLLLY